MPKRKIYLVSPREPSGATWLINCLLELGIRTYRYSRAGMWRSEKGRCVLNTHEQVLRKWLPALVDHSSFQFRDDLEVRWMHEWYTDAYDGGEVIYFVRDPRDALYSRYKREAPDLSYGEFVAFPDVYTLLDKVANWWLYTRAWLAHPRVSVFRFEDYKTDADRTLASVLEALQLKYDSAAIARATQCSTFERAAAAERAYREEHPEDTQLINRSGQPLEWQTGGLDGSVAARIETVCADLLTRFSYANTPSSPRPISLARHTTRLAFFSHLKGIDEQVGGAGVHGSSEDACSTVFEFIAALNPTLLERARLPAYELQQLRCSMSEYLRGLRAEVDTQVAQSMPAATQPDRETMPLALLQRGLWRRLRRVLV